MAPWLIPSIRSFPFEDVVNETVVPGHTRTSPPRVSLIMAVSAPAVMDDPDATRLPVSTSEPELPTATGTAAGCTPVVSAGTDGGLAVADWFPRMRIRSREPEASHV